MRPADDGYTSFLTLAVLGIDLASSVLPAYLSFRSGSTEEAFPRFRPSYEEAHREIQNKAQHNEASE